MTAKDGQDGLYQFHFGEPAISRTNSHRLPIGLILESRIVQLVLVESLGTQDLLQLDPVCGSLVRGHEGDILQIGRETKSSTLLLLLLVEVSEVGGLGEDEAEKSGPTSDVYFETSKVFRSFTSEVDLRSDDLWVRANCSVYVLNCRRRKRWELTFPTHCPTNMMAVVVTRLVEPAAFKLAQVYNNGCRAPSNMAT